MSWPTTARVLTGLAREDYVIRVQARSPPRISQSLPRAGAPFDRRHLLASAEHVRHMSEQVKACRNEERSLES